MKKATGLIIGLLGVSAVSAGIAVPAFASTHNTSSRQTAVSASAILKLLPKGAQIIASDKKGDLVQSLDLSGDGQNDYAALYKYSNGNATNLIGAIIVDSNNGVLQKLWQYNGNIGLVAPASLDVKEVLHNNSDQVVFTAAIGAMANQVEVLSWANNKVEPIFQTQAARVDIGQYKNAGPDEISAWTLDTGYLYNVQMYGWNSKAEQYTAIQSSETPQYFKTVVLPYYQKLENGVQGKTAPKMIAYGLAEAYYNSGEYNLALTQINKGLEMSAKAYPPNTKFQSLKTQVEASLNKH
ncbi:hypothetical protein AAC03nite_13100 [Alicyclobacillus acidoterrestris]|uniref:hypothetical protein n=1 Tax=Alicyclobacillus suci TaxID=2816080 RepID=UPI0011924ED8|nr:hypothetical protein [Alicyclobacillus suci]GEO25525.1 hypothetical protein AAC03nite_13100 [Alicyclobacillus acidoterrestris]